MPEQAVQALIDAFSKDFSGRLDTLAVTQANQHADVMKRLDAIALNGDAPALRQLARATPDLLRIANHASALEHLASEVEDSRAGWRWLRATVRWDHGVGTVVKWIVAGFIAAATLFLAAKLFAASPSAVPPSVPSVTAPPAVHLSPSPTVVP